MSVLIVTGGAGFIGANFVRLALAERFDSVVVIDKLTYAGNLANLADARTDPRLRFIQADIADVDAMAEVFREHRPGWVVNFAAESHVDRSIDSPGEFIRTNIQGVFVLLECARTYLKAAGPGVGEFRFLQVSTDEVYGSLGAEGLFEETTPYAPNSPYAASKASADHLVRAYQHTYGLPTVVTNCSNNYGPYQFPEKLIPLMILNGLEGKRMPIYGDGSQVRDWLYVEDHCRGVLEVLRSGLAGRSYNIGGRNERTNLEVVDRICDVLESLRPAAVNQAMRSRGVTSYRDLKTHVADRPGHDRRYAIDPTRIESELGWSPRHDFESGIEATVRWYLDHLDWCESVQTGAYRRERLGLGEN